MLGLQDEMNTNQKSEVRNQKSEIRNQKSEIRNQKKKENAYIGFAFGVLFSSPGDEGEDGPSSLSRADYNT